MPNNTEVIHTYRILKGNAPIDKNEVVINENLLQLLNKEIGDELEVSNNDGIFEKFIITGICENVSSTGSFFMFRKDMQRKENYLQKFHTWHSLELIMRK